MKTEQKNFVLSGNFTARYILKTAPSPKFLYVLLHGFSQTAEVFYEKIKSSLPEDGHVLSGNGPFPVPSISPKDGSFRTGFSWYFYESDVDAYYVDMELAQTYLEKLVNTLGFTDLPKKIVGYSQGGYLAPFIAQKLKNVEQVVGVNCEFMAEEIQKPFPKKMDLINGADDDTVDPLNAKKSFEKLQAEGMVGTQVLIARSSHGISAPILAQIAKTLAPK